MRRAPWSGEGGLRNCFGERKKDRKQIPKIYFYLQRGYAIYSVYLSETIIPALPDAARPDCGARTCRPSLRWPVVGERCVIFCRFGLFCFL